MRDSIRTPFGRHGGALTAIRHGDFGELPIKALMERKPGADGTEGKELSDGCANVVGKGKRSVASMASRLARGRSRFRALASSERLIKSMNEEKTC